MPTAQATRTFALPWGDAERLIDVPADPITAEIAFTDLPPLPDPAEALSRSARRRCASWCGPATGSRS
jgi:hypothetical protein